MTPFACLKKDERLIEIDGIILKWLNMSGDRKTVNCSHCRFQTSLIFQQWFLWQRPNLVKDHTGLVATKPFLGVSDKVRFKPAFSATGTSWKIEISFAASFDMVLSKKRITNALIKLRECADWSVPLLFTNSRRQCCYVGSVTACWYGIFLRFSRLTC